MLGLVGCCRSLQGRQDRASPNRGDATAVFPQTLLGRMFWSWMRVTPAGCVGVDGDSISRRWEGGEDERSELAEVSLGELVGGLLGYWLSGCFVGLIASVD